MLNRPADGVASPPDDKMTEKPETSALKQIAVILVVGLYLSGVVWLYVKLPWIALSAFAVAAALVVAGLLRQLRNGDKSPGR